MARRATATEITSGVCSFCQGEFDKRKMTQHLKYCKQRDEDDPVKILARNVPPTILCRVCGQSATRGLLGGYYDVETNAYCSTCTGESEDFLPVVNSPRVGVCGYTGGQWDGDVEEDEEWDDEEDDEDEDEEDEL